MSQTAIYNKLHFDSIAFNDVANGVNPRFKCPICQYAWQPKLVLGTAIQATFDYNQKVNFTIPTHNNLCGQQCAASNQKIELYIAVHKDTKGTKLIMQRTDAEGAVGIAANWWVNPQ